MAKKTKPISQGVPPSGGLPPSWTLKGVEYTIKSVDTESNQVEVDGDNGVKFYADFYKLRERLIINEIIIKL